MQPHVQEVHSGFTILVSVTYCSTTAQCTNTRWNNQSKSDKNIPQLHSNSWYLSIHNTLTITLLLSLVGVAMSLGCAWSVHLEASESDIAAPSTTEYKICNKLTVTGEPNSMEPGHDLKRSEPQYTAGF